MKANQPTDGEYKRKVQNPALAKIPVCSCTTVADSNGARWLTGRMTQMTTQRWKEPPNALI